VRYRVQLDTESGADGVLRRMLREVDASEGHSRVEVRAVGDDLELNQGVGRTAFTRRLAGAARDLKSDELAREWLSAVGRGEARTPLRFRAWDPVKIEVVEVEFAAVRRASGENVERRAYSSRATTGSLLRVDPSGNVVHEVMSLGAFQLVRSDAPQAEAQQPDQAFDHVSALLQKSPKALKLTHAAIRQARRLPSLEEALKVELRLTVRLFEDGEFPEGVRALLIDKDRKPNWSPARLGEVTPELVARYLAPLPAGEELTF